MSQYIYNTFSGKKEQFIPLKKNHVQMYLCGPTVYDFLHIGNFRGAIVFNLIRNWLEFSGNKVTFVYNYTDVDDKIIKRANDEGVETSVITQKYIAEFEKDFKQLGLTPHEHNPRVSDHMDNIIAMVEQIIAKGKAYIVQGEVFFNIKKFENYGALAKKNLDELEVGKRVEVDIKKTNPGDFVLWKPAKEGEPSWDSPWGKGRPGWHIECSAMVKALLGETIDIHGGGVDLQFPHHENEIAQSEACNGVKYSNFWVHNEYINFGAQKMSKSLGNVITARNFMKKYHGEILKYLFLSAHYRTQMSITDDKLSQAISGLNRVYTALEMAQNISSEASDKESCADQKLSEKFIALDLKIKNSLDDDFNSAELVSYIFEGVRAFNTLLGSGSTKKAKRLQHGASAELFTIWIKKYAKITALFNEDPSLMLSRLDEILINLRGIDKSHVEALVIKRSDARDMKEWDLADSIRRELESLGVELFDGHKRGWRVRVSEN